MPANERNKRLFAAARDGNTVDAEGALRAGCDVKALDNFNQTPLHWASAEGHVDMVKLLIKHGADVNLSDLYGFTPLHCAALEGRSSVARVLIDNGANVDAKNDDGENPLHWASVGKHWDIVDLLSEADTTNEWAAHPKKPKTI